MIQLHGPHLALHQHTAFKTISGSSLDDPECRRMLEFDIRHARKARVVYLDVLRSLTSVNLNDDQATERGQVLRVRVVLPESRLELF